MGHCFPVKWSLGCPEFGGDFPSGRGAVTAAAAGTGGGGAGAGSPGWARVGKRGTNKVVEGVCPFLWLFGCVLNVF